MYGISATIDAEASDAISITSQTAYRNSTLKAREDGSGMYFDFPFDPKTNTPDITSAMRAGLATYLATVPDSWFDSGKGEDAVSYTHLDVYKRQPIRWWR